MDNPPRYDERNAMAWLVLFMTSVWLTILCVSFTHSTLPHSMKTKWLANATSRIATRTATREKEESGPILHDRVRTLLEQPSGHRQDLLQGHGTPYPDPSQKNPWDITQSQPYTEKSVG
jgi:hypothetical protein